MALNEAPRPQGGASRARSGEQDASRGSFVRIVPLDLAGHVPVTEVGSSPTQQAGL